MDKQWAEILAKLYEKKLFLNTNTMRGSKQDKVLGYIKVLEDARKEVQDTKNSELEMLYKKFFHDLFVIKEENIPYSVYESEQRIARNRGYGNIPITEEFIKRKNKEIIRAQEETLDAWLDYFLWDEEAKHYPAWEVFWVLEGLQKIGQYDRARETYRKRDKYTTEPFPMVDKTAIFNTVNLMQEFLKGEKLPKRLRAALGQGNFKQLYEYSLKYLSAGKQETHGEDGIWIKYDQGSDYRILRNSLQGYNTGWCTAAAETFAESQLAQGDFYVYYSIDENGEYKIPRIAIRMNGKDQIGEIRGIEKDQHMESKMLPILHEKLKEFPDREWYYKKESDMKCLTKIEEKTNNGEELTIQELRFLYELDSSIEGFGWEKDPRIEEIIEMRSPEEDFAKMLNINPEQVAMTQDELNENTVVFYGSFRRNDDEVYFPNLKVIYGDVYMPYLLDAKGLKNLEVIVGDVTLPSLRNTEGLKNLKIVVGSLQMYDDNLKSSKGLENLQRVYGRLCIDHLENAEGFKNLEYVESLSFPRLISSIGFEHLKRIEDNCTMVSLKDAKGFSDLEYIGGDVWFPYLEWSTGLEKLKHIGGNASLPELRDASGLCSLTSIGYIANFDFLRYASGLEKLETIGSDLKISSILRVDEFQSLKYVGGDIEGNPYSTNNTIIKGKLLNKIEENKQRLQEENNENRRVL